MNFSMTKSFAISGTRVQICTPPLPRGVASKKVPVVRAETFDPATGVRCFVNADGHLQCEKLAPGDYVVKQTGDAVPQDGAAPGITYCFVSEEGELFCEGLTAGEYSVQTASTQDLEQLLEAGKQPQ
eukprot:TRINITY_DN760_c0_g1_i3.p2 TRINITY_DN760_c0_g1~~TRINITY_DN760_c0_g1_i3.p2  ORF type:complete len:127 (-),score=29.11 TRINITY_DN760_c0_g1_i3:183-563(-)